jgi:malate dehydrogenase (oxaloacetate-decarboxylating)
MDSRGLVHSGRNDLEPAKQKYAQPLDSLVSWQTEEPGKFAFLDVVRNVHPSILIGTSAQPGAFSERIIREIAQHVDRPIIFPLSNPTSKCEAIPSDLLTWTDGRALIATGSPFEPITTNGRTVYIGQCNNSFIFPGVGLGVLASGARRVTNEMFVAAALVLSEFAPVLKDPAAPLYPPLEQVREISREVAIAVALEAQRAGLADETSAHELERRIEAKVWTPHYFNLKRFNSNA